MYIQAEVPCIPEIEDYQSTLWCPICIIWLLMHALELLPS